MMKTILGSVSLMTLLLASAANARLAPCDSLTVATPPAVGATDLNPLGAMQRVPANASNCNWGVALMADARTTLWRCIVEYPDGVQAPEDAPSHALLLIRSDLPVQSFPDSVMAGALDAWRLFDVDLDGDGRREHVVALWNGQGNGLGINAWTLRIFSPDWQQLGERENVLDWGESGIVAASPGRRGCDIAITDYVDDAHQGATGYQARFVTVRDGRLIDVPQRGALYRRLTDSFQHVRRARDAAMNDGDGPLVIGSDVAAWLAPAVVLRHPRP